MHKPNTDFPLVSIILPVHNGHLHLQKSIDSVLAQSWPNVELVIVDDGSTQPETARILSELDDPCIRMIRLDKNVGLPEALNVGFQNAKGGLLSWTSDDNIYFPNAIETMATVLETTDVDFVCACSDAIDDDGKVTGRMVSRSADFLLIDNCVGACFLYTRYVMEAVGAYDSEMTLAEDYDYWVRVSKQFRMRAIPDVLYQYRYHASALTSTEGADRIASQVDRVRSRHFSAGEILAAQGLRSFHRGDHPEARSLLLSALLRRPYDARLFRPVAICLLPPFIVRTIVSLKARCGLSQKQ